MAISQEIWSLDTQTRLPSGHLTRETELEDFLYHHIEALNSDWLLIGKQVKTSAGKYLDLLCMDHDGDLIVIELKKDMTPREVTAQVIDYASCISKLELEELAEIYLHQSNHQETLNEAYQKKYNTEIDEESVNQNVKMIIVAAQMDAGTERIIHYLRDTYEVDINILFFHIFTCENHRLISRVYFAEDAEQLPPSSQSKNRWNQEYYVSFGSGDRKWNDAMKYGFISAGGGNWYTKTLKILSTGDRIWVNIPKTGYVGVGIVTETAQPAKDIRFQIDGNMIGFQELSTEGNYLSYQDDSEKSEYVVKVQWEKTIPETQAVKELGFFGNQNTVCRPTDPKWTYTIERLKTLWHIDDDASLST